MSQPVRKIVFVLPDFQAGGAERVMVTIANHLDRREFQPAIIVFHDRGPLREMVADDIVIIDLGADRQKNGLFRFARAVRSSKADLVISTMARLNMLVLLSKPFLWRIPIIVREAVTPSYFSDSVVKRNLLTVGYYILYPLAACILSPTRMVFDDMPSFFRRWPGKLCRIFNPVNVGFINNSLDPALRAQLTRPDQRLFVGAGRLVDQKGFDRLIGALGVWRDRDDWRLIILGEGPDHQKLQQMIDRHGLKQITLAGFESRPWRYFAVADAFVLPSRHEGLPNVALEALALGVPVIASDSAGGIGEIAAEAVPGAINIARNMDEFLVLMDSAALQDSAVSRPSLLPDSFSLSHVVASYQKIFTDVLAVKS